MHNSHSNGSIRIKGLHTCEHLVHHNAYGVDITLFVGDISPCLLGADVVNAAYCLVGDGLSLFTGKPCDAEIHDLYGAVGEKHDVLGLDVSVNYSPVVSVLQCPQYLDYEVNGVLPFKNALLLHKFLEGDAVDIFHYDELDLVAESNVVYLNDIGVAENGNSL